MIYFKLLLNKYGDTQERRHSRNTAPNAPGSLNDTKRQHKAALRRNKTTSQCNTPMKTDGTNRQHKATLTKTGGTKRQHKVAL